MFILLSNNQSTAPDNNNQSATREVIAKWLNSSPDGSLSEGVKVLSDNGTWLSESVFKMYGDVYDMLEKTSIQYFFGENERKEFLGALNRAQEVWNWRHKIVAECCQRMTKTIVPLTKKQELEQYNFSWLPGEEKIYNTIRMVLQDVELIAFVLYKLETLVAAGRPSQRLDGEYWYKSFLSILGPDFQPLRVEKQLKPGGFAELIRSGYLPLDPGADEPFYTTEPEERPTREKHGALSHVFQWLIIQEALTNANENNSRYTDICALIKETTIHQIFKRTGVLEPGKGDDFNATANLWEALVDRNPEINNGVPENVSIPEGVTTFIEAETCDKPPVKFFPLLYELESQIEREYRTTLKLQDKATFPSTILI